MSNEKYDFQKTESSLTSGNWYALPEFERRFKVASLLEVMIKSWDFYLSYVKKSRKFLASSIKRLLRLERLCRAELHISYPFQLQLSLCSMTFTLKLMILNDFLILCLGMFEQSRKVTVSIEMRLYCSKTLKKLNIITVLEERTQAILRNHFPGLRYIRAVDVVWKSLWICLRNSYYSTSSFAFEFLGSDWNSSLGCFTSNARIVCSWNNMNKVMEVKGELNF